MRVAQLDAANMDVAFPGELRTNLVRLAMFDASALLIAVILAARAAMFTLSICSDTFKAEIAAVFATIAAVLERLDALTAAMAASMFATTMPESVANVAKVEMQLAVSASSAMSWSCSWTIEALNTERVVETFTEQSC